MALISSLMYSRFRWVLAGSVFLALNVLLLWFTDPFPTIALIVLFNSNNSFLRRKPGFCYSFQE